MTRQFTLEDLIPQTYDKAYVEAAREYERLIYSDMQRRKTDWPTTPPVYSGREYQTATGARRRVVEGGAA